MSSQRAVIVTGAGAGIGRAAVAKLSERGFQVFACVREAATLNELGKNVTIIPLDLTQEDQVRDAALRVIGAVGERGLFGLVNAAGVVVDGPLELTPISEMRRQLEVNVIGRFAITRALMPALRRAKGRIVNIGAVSSRATAPFFACPAIASTAFAALSEAMRMEFGPFGINVSLIEPGVISTQIFEKAARAKEVALTGQPTALVEAYAPAMKAAEAVFANSVADSPDVVVDAITRALESRGRGKRRILVGRGAKSIAFVGILPACLKEPILMAVFGLNGPMRVTARILHEAAI